MRLLFLSLVFARTLFGIIDIASVDFGEKEKGFSGSLYGSFQKKRGNTDKDEAEYGGRIQYDTNKTITWMQGKVENDKAGSITTEDSAFLHLRHIRQLYTPSWASEYYIQLKQDAFKNLRKRTLFGVGLRYKIADSAQYGKLFFGLSLMDEKIRYVDDSMDPDEHNYRGSSYLSYKAKISDSLDFSLLGYYQPKLDEGSDYLISSMAEMTIHLTRVFDLSYLLELDYDTRPAHNVVGTDTRQKLSFVYRFGKEDPFSAYAHNFLNSADGLDEINASSVIAVEVETDVDDIKDSTDTLAGKWVFGKETFSILLDGEGSYLYEKGIYSEKFKWTLVSTDTQEGTAVAKNQSTKLVVIRFRDEEGRPGRVENYLWSENSLVGLNGSSVRLFKR